MFCPDDSERITIPVQSSAVEAFDAGVTLSEAYLKGLGASRWQGSPLLQLPDALTMKRWNGAFRKETERRNRVVSADRQRHLQAVRTQPSETWRVNVVLQPAVSHADGTASGAKTKQRGSVVWMTANASSPCPCTCQEHHRQVRSGCAAFVAVVLILIQDPI